MKLCILLLLIGGVSFGQTKVWVTDANLRTCLQGIDNALFDADDSLIVAQANVFGPQINCGGEGILNADELRYFTSITSLSLMGNDLTQIDSIHGLSSIESLYLSNNNLDDIPDLSNFPNLSTLFCEFNNLTELEGLNSTAMESINCSHNAITDLSGLTGLPLTWVVSDDNGLDTIPDVLSFPNVTFWSFRDNHLPIYYHEQAKDHPNFNANFEVKPTAPKRDSFELVVREGQEIKLQVLNIDTLANVEFEWRKNGTPIVVSNDWRLINPGVSFADSGVYTCMVTGLFPETADMNYIAIEINLVVEACDVQLASFDYETVFIDCTEGYEVGFGTPNWGMAPYTYQLVATESMEEIVSTEMSVTGIKEYSYALTIIDAENCEAEVDGGIALEEQDCTQEEIVFTPNNDGDHDFLFIPDSGEAKIYNTDTGLLLNTISIPTQWGGVDSNGEVLNDGYYLVVVNGEKSMLVAIKK